MTGFSEFAARLRGFMARPPATGEDEEFNQLALALFTLQFAHNAPYRIVCTARAATPVTVRQWQDIPAMPTTAFKELELTSLLPDDRMAVFHSSGTTEQRPSRHFHSAESMALYEGSMLRWFRRNVLPDTERLRILSLTPPTREAPNSSLVHMFETIKSEHQAGSSAFCGRIENGIWILDLERTVSLLQANPEEPVLLLGTAFLFVHLLDHLAERRLHLRLPTGSRIMETGGYKGRSRMLPKEELHRLIMRHLGVPDSNLICEYGMSELSSQAYDRVMSIADSHPKATARRFHFPPWARALIVSPETGAMVKDGEAGLLRILDLANAWSVMAVQTEDLAVRRGDGFELLGRATQAEPRGCSLMAN